MSYNYKAFGKGSLIFEIPAEEVLGPNFFGLVAYS
jgi:hypothetical protein